ncbi:MAG TPA: hypothetical protein VEU51_07655 [Candidatus Acidoferrales bacterium]|nr:hypothetical protein [Candidatus Acidoferrales bacterium]
MKTAKIEASPAVAAWPFENKRSARDDVELATMIRRTIEPNASGAET